MSANARATRPPPGPRDELYENWNVSVLLRPLALAQLRGVCRARSPRATSGLLAGRRGEDDRGKFVVIEAAAEHESGLAERALRRRLEREHAGLVGTGWFRTRPGEGFVALDPEDRREQSLASDERDVAVTLGGDGKCLAVFQGPHGTPVARALWALPEPGSRPAEHEIQVQALLTRAQDLGRELRALELPSGPSGARVPGPARRLAFQAWLSARRAGVALREIQRRLAAG